MADEEKRFIDEWLEKVRELSPAIRGSLTQFCRKCGRKGCRKCASGDGHPTWQLSYYSEGRHRNCHVGPGQLETVRLRGGDPYGYLCEVLRMKAGNPDADVTALLPPPCPDPCTGNGGPTTVNDADVQNCAHSSLRHYERGFLHHSLTASVFIEASIKTISINWRNSKKRVLYQKQLVSHTKHSFQNNGPLHPYHYRNRIAQASAFPAHDRQSSDTCRRTR